MYCHVVLLYLYKLLTGLLYGMVTGKDFFADMRKKIASGIWKSLENSEKEVDWMNMDHTLGLNGSWEENNKEQKGEGSSWAGENFR